MSLFLVTYFFVYGLLPRRKRPVGLAKKTFSVPASFFEELPEETLVFFRGEVA